MNEQWLGLLTGVLFGALLQQGRVLRFEKQLGALLLKDMTIFKFMLSAIIVGMVGINLLASLGLIELRVRDTRLAANMVGGALFGIGWAIAGFCPGTSVGAVAEGRWHAVWVILGMLVGAALFAEAYPALQANLLSWGALGKITLASVLGLSPWVVIPILAVVYIVVLVWFEKKGL
ncbi:MAG TPA: YeeE/YedE thiosulfate transporter family protein [Phycisphaerae bacterium]|nr:YeeE/YedE thiosulfate transporter family protein [Phycisphaerae bacterium]HRR83585.1 YeeE/YedE thiosulfate transporter family protein [Phycisphaerae bacterium]